MASEPPPSHFTSVQRACDRCFSLKTQCDFSETCARCQRLGLECTRQRPIRPRGRPRGRRSRSELVPSLSISQDGSDKDSEQGSNNSSSLGSAATLGVCQALLAHVPGQSLDPILATRLLHYMLSFGDGLGFYGILSAGMSATPIQFFDGNDQSSISLEAIVASATNFLTPTLLCSLLSVALELRRYSIPLSDQESAEYTKDSLRASSLAWIPTLSWHYRARVSDVFALLFFSATWCFTPHLIEVSTRWNNLASIIMMDVVKAHDSCTDHYERERERIAIMGIGLQQRALSLLLNRHFLIPSFSSSMKFPCCIHRAAYNLPPESYLGTFASLARAADLVLEEPKLDSRAWKDAYYALENFYMTFPSTLLKLADLQFLYHAESMIWMHGLFIILYAKRDLLDIIMGPEILSDEIHPHVLGHSLLLGEVLTSFERMNTNFESLSPATVFFLLVSCAVKISVLARYAPTSTEDYEFQLERGNPSVPERLATSSWVHLQVLSAVRARCTRFQSPVLCEIERLLASCYNRVVLRCTYTETISAEILMLHRWKGQGNGIVAMDPTVALAEWNFSQPPEADVWSHLGCHNKSLKLALDEVCSPRSRICEAGYFDLSILIRD